MDIYSQLKMHTDFSNVYLSGASLYGNVFNNYKFKCKNFVNYAFNKTNFKNIKGSYPMFFENYNILLEDQII